MTSLVRKCLALMLTGALLFTMVGVAAAAPAPAAGGPPQAPFWDTVGTKYQQAVDSLYALQVVTGKSDVSFDPNGPVTRAQMAAMVVRSLGLSAAQPYSQPFPDVPTSYWAAGAITAASSEGIIQGSSDGLFHPDDQVTYPQVVAMLIRSVGLTAQAGSYPSGYALLAKQLGLIDNVDWGLDKAAPRGDVALMLYQTIFTVKRGGMGPTLSQSVFKRAAGIVIEPAAAVVPLGTTTLSAKVVDWAGQPLEMPVNWAVTSGNATVTQSGSLTTTGDGTVTVKVSSGDLSATGTFTVVRSLTVKTDGTAVRVGAPIHLTATGVAASGHEVAVTPTWTVVSGNATITADGVLTLQGSGTARVRAAVGSLTGELSVSAVGGLSIAPTQVTIATGSNTQFTATITDANGNRVEAPVTWSVSGGGSIDQTGNYVAGSTPATVTARVGDYTATASVKLVNRLEVSPASGSFNVGDAQQFTATAYTSDSQPVPTSVTWSVEPSSIGIMGENGRFFAAAAGTGYVVANYSGMTTRIPVTVRGQAVGLRLSATPNGMPANGNSQATITARLVDAQGNTASGADSILFAVSNAKLGTLSNTIAEVHDGVATVTLTAGTASGSYVIYASAPGSSLPGISLTFTTTAPSISHVALEAYPNPLASDGVSQTTVTAKLIDASGSLMNNNTGSPVVVSLSASNTAAGRLSGYLVSIGVGQSSGTVKFTAARTPGTTVITGTSTYRVDPVTITSQPVGDAYRLKIHPVTGPVKADGTSTLEVNVEVQDINGNVRTGENNMMVSLSAVSPTGSLSVPSQQIHWGIATFKISTSKAGTYDVNVWSAGSAVQGDSTQITFSAGQPYKLDLRADPATIVAADGVTTATLRARILDANGNLVTSAANVVRFTLDEVSDGVMHLPSSPTVVAQNGEAVYQMRAGTSVGRDTFRAESDGLVASSSVQIATTITGVAVKTAVQSLPSKTIAVGQPMTVKVWVLDATNPGHLVTSDNGRTVYLHATNGGTVGGPATTVNGVATFTVSNTLAGDMGLTASAVGLDADTIGKVVTVAPGLPDHVVLAATPEALSADGSSRGYIAANLVDQYGNATGGHYTVSLSVSSSDYLTLSSLQVTTGSQVMVTAKGTPGTTTISGTSGAYAVAPLTISTYHSGLPTKVVVDQVQPVQAGSALSNQVRVKARILDQNGNLVTSLNTGSDLTAMALRLTGSGGNASTTISIANSTGLSGYNLYPNGVSLGSAVVSSGIATFTVTNTKAETLTLTPVVYYKGVQLDVVPGSMVTTAGPATTMTVSASQSTVLSTQPTSLTISASVTDSYGNPASVADDTITFSGSNSSMLGLSTQTVNAPNGSAQITVQSKSYTAGGSVLITARSSKYGLAGTTTVVLDQPPAQPTVSAWDEHGSDSTLSSGQGAKLVISVSSRQTDQQVIVYVNGVAVELYSTADFETTVDTIQAGTRTLTGYIKPSDVAGRGVKDIRVMVFNGLGMSPLSDSDTLTMP